MSVKVSIIVPVYNSAKTLRRCADSILNQDFTDYELFLVDDGSTDDSGAICDEYAALDNRVHVIHKNNSGVSDTRNTALDLAHGKYIQFLDSDDWITPDATKLLVRTAEKNNCDLVIADFYRVNGERVSQKGDIDEDAVLSKEEFSHHMMENPADFYYGVIWNKLYRRDIIEKHELRMNVQINWCEDFMFNLEYIRYAERFIALKVPIYHYVKTKGSLVSQSVTISNTVKMKLEIFEYYNNFYKHTFDEAYYEKNRLRIYHFLIDSAKDGFVMPSLLPGSKKLGSERTSVSPQALNGHGIIIDAYRSKMLLHRYLESAAIKHDLTLNDACLLLALENPIPFTTKKELANYAQLPLHILSLSLSHLSMRGFIQPLPIQHFSVCLLETATPVLDDLKAAINDFKCTCMRDFTKEESCLYRQLSERIHENVLESLR